MPAGRRPAVVVIHGGGWIEGDKSSFASALHGVPGNIEEFARLGFVAATINYRLSREAPFPAALDDCRAAVRYLRAHAEEFRIDPEHVGAYGNSAGGHLALLLSMNEEPSADDTQDPAQRFSSGVQASASDSGPLDLTRQHQQNQLRGVIETFLGGPPQGKLVDAYRRASPAAHPSVKAPLLLIYGADDEQVDVRTADEFVAALVKAGHQDVSYIRLAKVGHCPHSLVRVPWLKPVVNDFFLRTLEQK
jgi:acetyl esterase/lipase